MLLFITILSVIVGFLIALAVLLKNNKNPINIWLFVFLCAVCFWVAGTNFLGTYWIGQNAVPLRLPFVFALIMAFAALRFAYALTNKKVPKVFMSAEIAVLGLCILLSISPFVIQEGYFSVESGRVVALERAAGYPVVLLATALFLGRAIFVIYRARAKAVGKKRVQLALVLLGLSLGTGVGILTNVIMPNIVGTVEPARYAFTALLIMAVVLSYAILRHRFMDIRLAITRGLAYLLTILAIAVVYVVTIRAVASLFFSENVSRGVQLFDIIAAVVIALSFDPLRRFFDRFTKSIFYQDAYEPREVLDSLTRILVRETSVKHIAKNALKILKGALKSEHIGIIVLQERGNSYTVDTRRTYDAAWVKEMEFRDGLIVQDDDMIQNVNENLETMKEHDVAVVAKIETSQEIIGYAFFGYKSNGSAYSAQDISLIGVVVDELAVAMQNALRFEEIAAFNTTLKQEVKDATAQLRDSNRKLHKLDEAKDEFISMASHQLRTPLTSVKGYLSMALEGDAGELAPAQKKLLEEAFTSAQRMVYLIGDFLNVSRLQTGKFVLELRPVNLGAIVAQELDQLGVTAGRRNITLDYTQPQHFPMLQIDEDKIRQVIMNLIDNAIFYSRPGGKVVIELLSTGRDARFAVHDTGIGVPARERHSLFSKFFRAENARKVRPDGTGIGLFMAKKVITAHGGSIVFESQEGKGSTFGFSLPLTVNPKPVDE